MRKLMLALLVAALAMPSFAATKKHKAVKEVKETKEEAKVEMKSEAKAAPSKSKIEYGIELGYGVSKFVGDRIDINGTSLVVDGTTSGAVTGVPITGIWKSKTAAYAGVYAQLPLADRFFLRPGIAYVTKGSKPSVNASDIFYQYTDGEVPSDVTDNIDMQDLSASMHLTANYVEVPVLVGFNVLPEGGKFVPSVFAGPYFGYLVSSELSIADLVAYDAHNFVSKVDYGVAFGVGVKADRLSLNVRYDLGLKNVFAKAGKTENLNPQILESMGAPYSSIGAKLPDLSFKNSTVLVTLAYAIN